MLCTVIYTILNSPVISNKFNSHQFNAPPIGPSVIHFVEFLKHVFIWDRRKSDKQVKYATYRAEVIVTLSIIKKSRFLNSATALTEILQFAFPQDPADPPPAVTTG